LSTIISPCSDSIVCGTEGCKKGWIKDFGQTVPVFTPEGMACLVGAPDGTIYAAGYRSDSLALFNLTTEGDVLWMRTPRLNGLRTPRPTGMIVDSEGNLVVTGSTLLITGATVGFVLKYNPALDAIIWLWNTSTPTRTQIVREQQPGGNYLLSLSYLTNTTTGIKATPALLGINRNTGTITAGGNNWSITANNFGEFQQLKKYKDKWWAVGTINDSLTLMRFSLTGQEELRVRYFIPDAAAEQPLTFSDIQFYQDTIVLVAQENTESFVDNRKLFIFKTTFDGQYGRVLPYVLDLGFIGSPINKTHQFELLPNGDLILLLEIRELLTSPRTKTALVRLSWKGAVRWSNSITTPRLVYNTKNHLLIRDNYIFIASEISAANNNQNFWIARINAKTGNIGSPVCTNVEPVYISANPSFEPKKTFMPALAMVSRRWYP